MNRNATILVYAALIAATALFGFAFRSSFQKSTSVQRAESSTNQAANTGEPGAEAPSGHTGQMMAYGVLGLLCLSALGLLAARDISNLVAHRVEKFIFDEDLEGERHPEYEEAEKVWANGQHLEAIQLMRNYLQIHPREQYVALRIAEIYEKDLGNYVAASLEYEEILRKNLPPERWGWAAIHLSNLYSGKLNKTEQATALLRRIIAEHPTVAAAKKARERLGEPEPAPEPLPSTAAAEEQKAPASNLPPGFRPK
jgi:tetratricopeptide (TPR) repeat protein